MTLLELSIEYRRQADILKGRIKELDALLRRTKHQDERDRLCDRIRDLSILYREARALAVLTARYYERGYHRDERYTL